ncbi:hypothetical protein E1A91_A06G166300v1 [Gossypium mustelinum]|uniref:Uncharacterized protein n=1 Tax=Gossypium mustelinum TaxID=34275 RepID=A0A5D2YWP5_GOSMU|nr:hypothetical protein E1A91_A06G166300v1 [Gossypium mustelinum]
MKKLYRRGTVHSSPSITTDHLSFLPATILTLSAALSPEDKQVLAYLISCSNNDFGNFSGRRENTPKPQTKRSFSSSSSDHDHPPLFTCDCFRCYMSYWVRWDSSPNRQLIHEIIDAFEDEVAQSKKTKSKKERKKKGGVTGGSGSSKRPDLSLRKGDSSELKTVEQSSNSGDGGNGGGDDGEEGIEKGSVRRLVSFIGERIWNVWGQ